ncbi:Transcription termination/antitermination protein NusA [Sulfidibacter corallicola]|uniref:Transcription termination/antitermination protein NusA n=1 Tax=Sulfidibacter corallicola TaxID=2818388 RepID=A0A8A4TWP1_SULCO|nr:transcription termination factor NusA [Sulfidibacter corallicola]QTD53544.1 transcription termination/antitermination protein NusA [Sulfidibacter corallicola]
MSSQLLQAIDQVSREKGIDAEIIISAVEEAIIAASKKIFKNDENFGARFDRHTGNLEVWAIKEVVSEVMNPRRQIPMDEAQLYYEGVEEGDTIEFQKDTSQLGRIAAHAAKQVILQKVRDAEKEKVFKEYSERIGEVVTAVVRRFERGNVIVDLGNNVEGIMYKDEQSRNERYSQNDRTKVVIVGSDRSTKEPQVKVSRSDARLLIKLFEMEVPEVYDETVVIKNAAREAGDRSKIAVYSTDGDVDPIGACVGMGGSRVRSIIRELKGERLDIIRYSDDISLFASNALSPAKINRVVIADPLERRLEVIVDEDQLSLAIGKKGINVRLASKLVGWTIEVKTEEQKRVEASEEMERLAQAGEESEPTPVKVVEEETVTEEMVAEVEAAEDTEETVVPEPVAEEDEVVPADADDEDYESEEEGEEGVSLEYLDGLTDERRKILEAYSIYYIEDLLYTDPAVLNEIPELTAEDVQEIIQLAKAYEQEFGEEDGSEE